MPSKDSNDQNSYYALPTAQVDIASPIMQEIKHVSSIPQRSTNNGSAKLYFFDNTVESLLVEQHRETALKKTEELLGVLYAKILDNSYLYNLNPENILHIISKLNEINQKKLLPVGYDWSFMSMVLCIFLERIKRASKAGRLIPNLIYNLGLFSSITLIPADYSALLDLFMSNLIKIPNPDFLVSRVIYGLGLLSKKGVHVEINLPVLLEKFGHKAEVFVNWNQIVAQFYAGIYLLKQIHSIDVDVYNYILTKKETLILCNKTQYCSINELNMLIAEYILSDNESSEHNAVACRFSNNSEDEEYDDIATLIKSHIEQDQRGYGQDSIAERPSSFSRKFFNTSTEQKPDQNSDYALPTELSKC